MLLYRKGDRNYFKNYKPLNLTNTNNKIIPFVFARRLQKIVEKIICSEQSAYIKGRFIGINARLVLDIYDCFMVNNSEGLL